ncbi:50S ribosomal protein L30e-like protein [Catenaria anguillulae PL171]|uniref:H/ACA ribonucleoprotein complex subunit 2 n=1 Tax=Catenaria anguillulae PL171 TaxID=765915 RepID=A0A1Y2H8E4_9FUNG|nr:50S ribosomal protein L30e-like protein [Catenaria anguillulae PL171]
MDVDKKSKKSKKSSSSESTAAAASTGVEKQRFVSPIASPMANPDLAKKVLKTVKKATAGKACRRGTKEVVKALRKGEKGIVVLAADVTPIDVISHIPVLCEDNECLCVCAFQGGDWRGWIHQAARQCHACVGVQGEGDAKEAYESVKKEMKSLVYTK